MYSSHKLIQKIEKRDYDKPLLQGGWGEAERGREREKKTEILTYSKS